MTESSAPPSATNGSDGNDSAGPGPDRAGPATPPSGTAVPGQDPDPTGGVPVQSVGPAGTAGEHTDLRAVLEATRSEVEDADCPECGAGADQAVEGACGNCGARRPAVRDHVEFRLGPGAAVTDRGLRRRRNEDACALGRIATPAGEVLLGAVCDGVASARRGDEASLAAAEAAVAAVLTRIAAHGDGGAGLDTLAATAAGAAAEAAADLVRFGGDPSDPPATTYTGAVTRGGSAVVSWVGDSRVYWLAPDGTSQLLSTDDSWAEEIAAAGVMTREQAHADRRAHVLTRWLGHDSPEGPARARRFRPAGPGYLLLCSDGIWNHIPDPDRLAALLSGDDVLADARALVDAALAEGGHDNATVALLPLDPGDGGGEWGPRPDGSDDTGPILIPLDGDDHPDDAGGAGDDPTGGAGDPVDPTRPGHP
ncbi:PP2C family serine/threonine-protein phosphatase [Actinomycetospora sp. TBRC 11914]|uniref:PP2C family protein-serine/threonine phosphatase n=1 Tax=Actinomycetospora sp. TBRC 11914 TaxID=2729387 RepID=UPI00145CE996|nr:PP2C family serine/threonine-protein phosphatase [Actinomycetospora sp. TBRC 11914]NMO90096.1 serine/threonine-protein phosphatase [Actinomycetospora sp. TBRC 11914]